MNVKGLEQAREEFNKFEGSAVIFIDMKENEAWCDVFEIKEYHDDAIVSLVGKNDFHSPNDKYTLSTLKELATAKKKKFEQGYDRMELEDDYHFAEILYYA